METFCIQKNKNTAISCVKEIPSCPKGIVIAVHGFSSSKESATVSLLLKVFPKKGLGVIGIDLPGHGIGESLKETLSIAGAIDSIAAAERYAVSLYPDCPVYYFASSFGAYLTGIYISTREHRGRKAFFRSAAVNMPTLFIKDDPTEKEREQYRQLDEQGWFETGLDGHDPVRITRGFMQELGETDLFKLFSPEKYGIHKVAMAHGENDTLIDPAQALRFAKMFGIPVTTFKGEGHSLSKNASTPFKVADLAAGLFLA